MYLMLLLWHISLSRMHTYTRLNECKVFLSLHRSVRYVNQYEWHKTSLIEWMNRVVSIKLEEDGGVLSGMYNMSKLDDGDVCHLSFD